MKGLYTCEYVLLIVLKNIMNMPKCIFNLM